MAGRVQFAPRSTTIPEPATPTVSASAAPTLVSALDLQRIVAERMRESQETMLRRMAEMLSSAYQRDMVHVAVLMQTDRHVSVLQATGQTERIPIGIDQIVVQRNPQK